MESLQDLENYFGYQLIDLVGKTVLVFCYKDGYKEYEFLGFTKDEHNDMSIVVRPKNSFQCELVHPSRITTNY